MVLFVDGGSAVELCCFGILSSTETSWAPFIADDEGLLLNFVMEKFSFRGGTILWWGLGCWVVFLWHYLLAQRHHGRLSSLLMK